MNGQRSGIKTSRTLSIEEWHSRFIHQAEWTRQARKYIYSVLDLKSCSRVLEVGSGTGVITLDITSNCEGRCFGLDIDFTRVLFSRKVVQEAITFTADAYHLPFSPNVFDQVYSHFFLLWMKNGQEAIRELIRVIRPGGVLIFLAEPDYGSRIDYPKELQIIGKEQSKSLITQGADPRIGRKLPSLLVKAGLVKVNVGLIQWGGKKPFSSDEFEDEWRIIVSDLADQFSAKKIKELKTMDRISSMEGTRVTFTPTFYAWGFKP